MQKPSLGRNVLVKVDPAMNNGSDTASATITRVWSDDMVNIRVTLDAFTMPLWLTSVVLCANEEEALSGLDSVRSCYWPPRV